jgi:hypothetical protein
MPGRGQLNKLYRSFNKGLITEAGFLTYPEDASTDELNTILYKAGNRSRRFGIDYEDNSTAISLPGLTEDSITTEYLWKAPDDIGTLNFLVVQVDNILHFFDMSASPLSSGHKSFTINLHNFRAANITNDQVSSERVQMAGGKGYLFVASQYIDPFTVEYNQTTDTVNAVRVFILMRDFDGISDGLPNDAEPTTLTKEHHYNLKNQGWVTPGTPSVQTTTPSDDSGTPPDEGGGTGTPAPAPDTGGTPTTNVYYDPYTGRPVKLNDWFDDDAIA